LEHELSLNFTLIEQLSKIAQPKGFIVDKTLPQDTATIYGKSQPDLTIYKSDGGYIRGTRIVGAAIKTCEDDMHYEVTGGAIELKRLPVHQKGQKSKELLQAFANMVRVGGFLTNNAVSKGKLIDEINIYGLLVSHTNPYCLPLLYHTNCQTGSTQIMKGDAILFKNALPLVLTLLQ